VLHVESVSVHLVVREFLGTHGIGSIVSCVGQEMKNYLPISAVGCPHAFEKLFDGIVASPDGRVEGCSLARLDPVNLFF
jgi:hypothetical protein